MEEDNVSNVFEEIIEPQERYKIFDIEKDFDVTIGEQKEIQERIKEEEKAAGIETTVGDFERKVTTAISNLEEKKFQNKMNYISSIAGETVSSEGIEF